MFVLAITCGVSAIGISIFGRLDYYARGKANMHTIESALHYAKSLAAVEQSIVTVCGSVNGYRCSENWQHGVLVLSTSCTYKFFKLQSSKHTLLTLQQSGYLKNSIHIHPNTMTYTNGHFTYKSLKASDLPPFKLYFNKALRMYHTAGN